MVYRTLLRCVILACLVLPGSAFAQGIELTKIGTYETGIFDGSAAEISTFDAMSQRVFFTNAEDETVEVLDISNPYAPILINTIDVGGGPNSVDAYNGVIAVAVEGASDDANGYVKFYDYEGNLLQEVEVGVLPDMLTFTPDGSHVLSANEGQPLEDYSVDPEGSVSIIQVSDYSVRTVGFTDFNAGGDRADELPDGVRIFGLPDAPPTVAQDLEPEYITVSPDGGTAYVTLQENNALAVIDVAAGTVSAIVALGTKDHSVAGNEIDASNRDDAINFQTWPVLGMYQPDAIASYEVDGNLYLITANEGDARDYDGFSEEVRVEDLTLDPTAYPNAAELQMEENLGRLRTTNATGDTDGDGDFDQIYSYGARSFTIWDASGNVVYDSGSFLETKTAELLPDNFNSTNDENDSFDNRSDDKGPEPEAVTIATIDGTPYAFIGLERVGGVMVFDVSDPAAPVFVTYNNARDFSVIFDPETITAEELSAVGDLGAESIEFIPASVSPNGQDLIVVANEVSGTVSFFEVGAPRASEPVTLTVLHNNDGESQLLFAPGNEDFGGAARFKTLMDNLRSEADENGAVVTLSSGDNFLAGPEFQVSLTQPEGERLLESIALDLIGYDALAVGNHEFDFGPDILERLIRDFPDPTPFLSANLDFSAEPGLADLEQAGRLASSTILEKDGELFGVIGATTTTLPLISSPRDVVVMENVAELVQAEIDALEMMGVNKIILISHLQGVEEDLELIGMLSGVDITIAGGGGELLANDDDLLVPGDEISEKYPMYPITATDMDGSNVPVVTTSGDYKYIGRLIVDFDADGNITAVSDDSGPVRVSGIEADAVDEDQEVVDQVTSIVAAGLAALEANIIASSEVGLDGVRANVRTMETNLGNLIADGFIWQVEQVGDQFGAPLADVALINGGGIRNDNVIPAGDISELNTFDILPFSNFVAVVPDIPASQFKDLLERAVSGAPSASGRFAHVAGVEFIYDPNGTDLQVDIDGNITQAGTRIRRAILNDGTVIVNGGQVVPGAPSVNVVTTDFTARGGDGYPFDGADFTILGGISYQQSLANYIVDGLGGSITAAQYPEGGEGRVTAVEANAAITLTVLHNNDGESQLLFAPGNEDFGGAARFKTLMDNLREEADEEGAVVTLSSGDNFLAGPEFQVSLTQPEGDRLLESIVLDLIGYDALAIGNHEFDFGPDILQRLIEDFPDPTPFLSANLDFSGEAGLNALVESGRIAKSHYVVKDGQLIGIVGATTPTLPLISSPRDVVVMENIAELVQAEIDALEMMGVNKIILISHLQGVEEDLELIGMLTGVDITIAGGGGELLANEGDLLVPGDEISENYPMYPIEATDMEGNNVPVVTTSGDYKYIGRLVVDFDADGNITSVSDDSGPVRVSGIEADAVAEDQQVVDQVTSIVAAGLATLEANIIASSEVGLDGVRANVRTMETNLANLIADAFIWQVEQSGDEFGAPQADVALINGGGIRNDNVIPAGDISELNTFDILPFSNFLAVVPDIPATQFKDLLERAVSATPSASGRFAHYSGVIVRYDPEGTALEVDNDGNITQAGTRIQEVRLTADDTIIVDGGVVVDGAPSVTVVTTDFTARGGDGYPFDGADFVFLGGISYQQALANYISDGLGGSITAAQYPEGGEGRVLTTAQAVSVEDGDFATELPEEYSLKGNYPNPFNPTTTISFSLPETAEVGLAVYDLLGRQVALLVNQQMDAGNHEIRFGASNLPSGTYFYRLTTPGGTFVKQMVLLK